MYIIYIYIGSRHDFSCTKEGIKWFSVSYYVCSILFDLLQHTVNLQNKSSYIMTNFYETEY